MIALICYLYFYISSLIFLVPCRGRECSHHAECVAQGNQGICQCPKKCPGDIKPHRICATDGNTYDNECELKRASCLQQKPVQVKHKGPCGKCLFLRRRFSILYPCPFIFHLFTNRFSFFVTLLFFLLFCQLLSYFLPPLFLWCTLF